MEKIYTMDGIHSNDQLHDHFRFRPMNIPSTRIDRPKSSSALSSSPIQKLNEQLDDFFHLGLKGASVRIAAIQDAVVKGETQVSMSNYLTLLSAPANIAKSFPWNSCKLAATLVLLLASPVEHQKMFDALRSQSPTLGGLPTMSTINTTPSEDLGKRIAAAKQRAFNGKVPICTILNVGLIDVEMIERGEEKIKPMGYTSFAHTFTFGISLEGWYLYQAWGEHGYTLMDWLERGGGQIRDWKEMKPWLKTSATLTTAEGPWTQKINDAYEKCFDVSMLRICGPKKVQKPIVPVYRPWVRCFEIVDVKQEHVEKFMWDNFSL